MSTTPDWMHGGGQDWDREPERKGLPLGGVIFWAVGLIATALGAATFLHLAS